MIKRIELGDDCFTLIDDEQVRLDEFEEKESETRIYFIECQTTKLIKIGISTNVNKRFRDIQSMTTTDLKLLTSIRGGRHVERQLHRRFAMARRRGEWFLPVHSMLQMIGVKVEQEARFIDEEKARRRAQRQARKDAQRAAESEVQKESLINPLQDLMTVTGLSEYVCKHAIDAGELPGYKDGQAYVVPEHELNLFCQGRWRPRLSRIDSSDATT